MILESAVIVAFALLLDFLVGDPRTKYHPTAWMGKLIASLVPFAKNNSAKKELLGGILIVSIVVAVVSTLLVVLDVGISLLTIDVVSLIVSIAVGSILLKTTIAIRGMQKHAWPIILLCNFRSSRSICLQSNKHHRLYGWVQDNYVQKCGLVWSQV